jgi:hypothetical protein
MAGFEVREPCTYEFDRDVNWTPPLGGRDRAGPAGPVLTTRRVAGVDEMVALPRRPTGSACSAACRPHPSEGARTRVPVAAALPARARSGRSSEERRCPCAH